MIALVVQPGVEFDHHKVIDYRPDKARALSAFIERDPQFIFEAHSTDYQTPENLRALVRDHFAILKVGPGRHVRAARDAVGARGHRARVARRRALRRICVPSRSRPCAPTRATGAATITIPPRESLDLQYSLSDRIRYYWPYPQVQRGLRMHLLDACAARRCRSRC